MKSNIFLCLQVDVAGGLNNIIMSDCDGNAKQLFQYEPDTRRIVMPGEGCLDWDYGDALGTGANSVIIFPCHSENNQKWWYDSSFRLRNDYNSLFCLDYGSTNVYMYECVSFVLGRGLGAFAFTVLGLTSIVPFCFVLYSLQHDMESQKFAFPDSFFPVI